MICQRVSTCVCYQQPVHETIHAWRPPVCCPPPNACAASSAALSGNMVEWYDWYVYAAFSLYFAKAFFPKGDTTAQLLNTAAIFAVGFLMRPIGGWLMGLYADKVGRKAALMASVLPDVLRLAADRPEPRLRNHRHRRADPAGVCPPAAGPVGRWRVRHLGDLPQRNGHQGTSRLLLQLPVRDPDLGSAHRAGRADRAAKRS